MLTKKICMLIWHTSIPNLKVSSTTTFKSRVAIDRHMPDEWCNFYRGNLPVEIFVLHGYKSKVDRLDFIAKRFNKSGFNVICCEYLGHGKRKKEGNNMLWFDSMVELEDVISRRPKKVVLIGLSMGGTIALSIGARMKKVSQVFAISAAFGKIGVNPKEKSRLAFLFNEDFDNPNVKQIRKAMPTHFEKCEFANRTKFFLIHCKNDDIVPFQEFERNVEALCLPETNTLVYDRISGIGSLDHMFAQWHPRTMKFIEKNIIRS